MNAHKLITKANESSADVLFILDCFFPTKSIAQFMDRDTRPDFASTVMIPAIQSFLKNPKDIDGLVNGIEKQKQSIFAS